MLSANIPFNLKKWGIVELLQNFCFQSKKLHHAAHNFKDFVKRLWMVIIRTLDLNPVQIEFVWCVILGNDVKKALISHSYNLGVHFCTLIKSNKFGFLDERLKMYKGVLTFLPIKISQNFKQAWFKISSFHQSSSYYNTYY